MTADNRLPFLFEDAVEMFADTVTRVCIVHLGNTADAQDCFQNTFIKLYAKFPDFENREHLKAWLIRVAINECRSVKRNARRQNYVSLDEIAGICIQPPADGGTLDAVMQLNAKYRDVLYLHYYEGYSVAEISQLLSVNQNTVKTRLSRARNELHKLIEGGEQ